MGGRDAPDFNVPDQIAALSWLTPHDLSRSEHCSCSTARLLVQVEQERYALHCEAEVDCQGFLEAVHHLQQHLANAAHILLQLKRGGFF